MTLVHDVRKTPHGYLRGENDGEACRFLGIPYGGPVSGRRRFQAPLRAEPWTGVRDALRFGPAAAQVALPDADLTHMAAIMAEDCLYLNVFTPSARGGGHPVMVYLHGGGWTNYTASTEYFDLGRLAATQSVVAVTLNHRLGVMGFLDHGGCPNIGLLDICMALEWVRDNIAFFGGDPACVTIFGQSGGGAKVAAMMAFAPAAGLFHRVIVQSASGSTKVTPPEEARMLADALHVELGSRDPRHVPLQDLLLAAGRVSGIFRPILDGTSLAGHPFSPTAPQRSAGIPMLVGCTTGETDFHLRRNPANRRLTDDDLRKRLHRFLPCDTVAVEAILQAYIRRMPDASPRDLLVAITSAHLFLRNTYRMGELQADNGADVYAYQFAGLTRLAPHCSELPFIFGTTSRYVGADPRITRLSHCMMKVWADFARHGHPGLNWPAYSRDQRSVMTFGETVRMTPDPLVAARPLWAAVPEYEYNRSRGDFIRG